MLGIITCIFSQLFSQTDAVVTFTADVHSGGLFSIFALILRLVLLGIYQYSTIHSMPIHMHSKPHRCSARIASLLIIHELINVSSI